MKPKPIKLDAQYLVWVIRELYITSERALTGLKYVNPKPGTYIYIYIRLKSYPPCDLVVDL